MTWLRAGVCKPLMDLGNHPNDAGCCCALRGDGTYVVQLTSSVTSDTCFNALGGFYFDLSSCTSTEVQVLKRGGGEHIERTGY